MKLPDVNIKLVAASLSVALVLLFGGNALVRMTSVSMPVERLLGPMTEIKSYSVERTSYGTVLDIELSGASDLPETIRKVTLAAARLAGREGVWIRIRDSRDDILSDVYYRLHLLLQEAMATGSFAEMERRVEETAHASGISDARIVVDSEYVYVSMSHGANQLYEVLPRRWSEAGAVYGTAQAARSASRSSGVYGGVRIW